MMLKYWSHGVFAMKANWENVLVGGWVIPFLWCGCTCCPPIPLTGEPVPVKSQISDWLAFNYMPSALLSWLNQLLLISALHKDSKSAIETNTQMIWMVLTFPAGLTVCNLTVKAEPNDPELTGQFNGTLWNVFPNHPARRPEALP